METKKSLGQHFLKSSHYLRLIADTAALQAGEYVLEIGPGEGVLTRELLAQGARVVAVEKDRRLIPLLRETFAQELASGQLQLVEDDILRLDISSHIQKDEPYKIVANIPYYITGAILEQFLSAPQQPLAMVLLVQKEVAERIARSKKESMLSLSVKAYGEPQYVKTVPAGAFAPPPEVDSAILSIQNISRDRFADTAHEKRFFALVRAGFAHKRKLLVGNVKSVLGADGIEKMGQAGIPANARAEDVALACWLTLSSLQA